jgi:hypothetical protein
MYKSAPLRLEGDFWIPVRYIPKGISIIDYIKNLNLDLNGYSITIFADEGIYKNSIRNKVETN